VSSFQTSIDIANRALQHCGVGKRITAFTDDSKAASAVSFCYDKLREAELRRNNWIFSIRKAALRPVSTTTKLLSPAAWASGTTYAAGAVVLSGGQLWESTAAGNLAQTPGLDASAWEIYAGPMAINVPVVSGLVLDTSYFSGELVLGNGSNDTTTVYRSLTNQNDDIPPTANWLSLGAVSAVLSILYPVGAGPSNQSDTRNVFLKPNGFLRAAPQDPKQGNISFLGAPGGNSPDDWAFEDDFIVSANTEVFVFRFTRSVTKVPTFDPMFCEGLAARIGLEICEELTQSAEKLQTIGSQYKLFMNEAREVNGIEVGPVESPEDDWIVCRI
jgi:hypothetical protein